MASQCIFLSDIVAQIEDGQDDDTWLDSGFIWKTNSTGFAGRLDMGWGKKVVKDDCTLFGPEEIESKVIIKYDWNSKSEVFSHLKMGRVELCE